MIIGVRFCGGCNPMYDRGAMLEKIKERFKDRIEFAIASEGIVYDGILVLGGCHNCCASYDRFETKTDPILMYSLSQEESIYSSIGSMIDKRRKEMVEYELEGRI